MRLFLFRFRSLFLKRAVGDDSIVQLTQHLMNATLKCFRPYLIQHVHSVLVRIWIFFKKKELLKICSELFAKERGYPSTAKIWRMYIRCAYYMPAQVAVI